MTSLQDALGSYRRQAALQQRARLLDAVWADVRDAPHPLLPRELLPDCPPPDRSRLIDYAVDLAYAPDGVWRVTSDHVGGHPGASLLEAPVLAAFLPALCRRLLREPLLLPSMPAWWLGDRSTLAMLRASPARYSLRGAFDIASMPIPLSDLSPATRRSLQDAVTTAPYLFIVILNLELSLYRTTLGATSHFGDS